MKILCIGNSFSYDANVYLYEIAKASGFELTTLNLYIGGCSLERHAKCIAENLDDYRPQYNGAFYEDRPCTVEDGLLFDDWDYVSLQQVSGLSGKYESYFPHINSVIAKVKELRPNAKIIMHETWAYEKGSEHPDFAKYENGQIKMHNALHDAYYRVARDVGMEAVIPSGDVMARLRELDEFNVSAGGESLSRDGFHLSLTYGRYAAAATWFQALGMGDILKNTFVPKWEGEPEAEEEKLALIKKVVKEICAK